MNLYIQVENDKCVGHPAFEDNLIAAFGSVPSNWEPFVRVTDPTATDSTIVLESAEPTYEKIDGVWCDVWKTRPKTPEELAADRQAIINAVQKRWKNRPYLHNFSAWVFDEVKMTYVSPVPYPQDGKFYRWSGPDNNWKEAEPFPQDGKRYYFDFDNWVNVEITDV